MYFYLRQPRKWPQTKQLQAMQSIAVLYQDLTQAALVKVFILADLLGVTPKEAAQIYLNARAKEAQPNQTATATA
jgi:hypothetical protein